ncbi:winged helix-turn-helix domain-containing protein [Parafrankia sp. FMc2]|uniref:winged helix-turn-helix domain-containing protein n=1 Tax=Parafrankia sp. FMc2 TaxID=3233196 RepID=UPI0034D50B29
MPVEYIHVHEATATPATSASATTTLAGQFFGQRTDQGSGRRFTTPGTPPRTRPLAVPGRAGIHLDRASWDARADGRRLDLTYLEFEVLDFLVRSPGRVHSRAVLLRDVWGNQGEGGPVPGERSVDVLITRLRNKIGPGRRHEIETVRRVGYRYRPSETASQR